MKTNLPRHAWAAISLSAILLCSTGHTAITVIDYYRLGDADAGATNGAVVNATSQDSVGTAHLTRIGSPTYTNGVSFEAALRTGTALAVSFSTGKGLSNAVINMGADNYGIEVWARANVANAVGYIVFNGNTTLNGWGILQSGTSYAVVRGGSGSFGAAPVTAGAWTHLALVRAGGTATLYMNGAPAGTGTAAPLPATDGFGIGQPGQSGASQNFNGQIDEVRVFTFAPGQFSTNDLLYNSPITSYPVKMSAALQTDVNGNGLLNPGDNLRYTIDISNSTAATLSGLVYNSAAVSNAPGVVGSLRATPLARADAPAANSAPGSAFHGSLNTTLNVPAVSGLLSNDFLGLPAAQIASFGGGVFGGSVTANAAGATSVAPGIGSLTINADGSLTFAPVTGFSGPITFQYRLTNSPGFSDATSQVNIGNRPNGTNDTFTVTGNTLLDTALIPATVLANDAGDFVGVSSSTAPAHGTASVAANGQFTYNPALGYTGADSFTYTLTNALGSATATVNLTVTNKLWYVDNSVAVNGDGRSSSPFKQTSDFTTANDGAAGHPADNDVIFLRQGAGDYTGNTTLRLGQKLIGDGASGTFSSLFGFSLAPGSAKAAGVAVPALTGTRPVISLASGTGVSLNSSNTVRGLNVNSANGRAFSGASVGALVIADAVASATGGSALNLNTGNVNVTLDSASSTNSVDTGITLGALSGTVTINGGFITGAANTDFQVSGGGATISFNGGINNSAGRSLDINGRTNGNITISGNIADTGTGLIIQNCTGGNVSFTGVSKSFNTAGNDAITFSNNTITATFNGGLVVNTTSGAAVSVAGGGTFNVNGAGNTFTTGTGPGLLNIGSSNTTAMDINASMTSTGGPLVTILNRTGGLVTLSGTLTNTSGSGITVSNVTGSTVTFSGGSKSLSTGSNTAVNLVNNNGGFINFIAGGLAITTTSGTGFNVIGGGTVTMANASTDSISTTTGTAFLNSGTGGSGNITLDANLTSTAGRVVDIQNRTNFTVTFQGNLNNTGGTGMLIQNNSGGTISLSAPTKTFSTGTNTAVNLVNNSGTTITFQNALTITTTSGIGFNATGGGTVTATDSATGNTINTGIGTALNVVDTTIGASGLRFQSISANGASSGIVLNNTGSSGSFSVVGNTPFSTVGGNNSGGTIQNTSGHGISLNSTLNPSFRNMNIHDTGGSGINGTNVTNFTFTSSKIYNSGNALGESCIAFNGNGTLVGTNIVGTLTVGDCILTNAFDCGIHVQNNAGTIDNLVITNNTITSSTNTNLSKGDGIRLVGTGNATAVGSLMNAGIRNNTVRNFPSGAGIQVNYGNVNATGPLATCGIPNDSANVIEITANTCRGNSSSNRFGTSAISISVSGGNSSQRSVGNFNVLNNGTVGNSIGNCLGTALSILNRGFATMTAKVSNNVIVASNTLAFQGIGGGNSILSSSNETPDLTLTVIGNNVSQTDGNGILLYGRGGTGTANLSIKTNTVAAPLTGVRSGIRVDAGDASSVDDAVCLDISGNTTSGSGSTAGIGLLKQGTTANINDFGIEGMAATATPGVEQYVGNGVGGKNPGSANGVADGSINGVLLLSAGSGFQDCSTAP